MENNMQNVAKSEALEGLQQETKVLTETTICGRQFKVYGTVEKPLFLAKDVAEVIEHRDVSTMMRCVDDDEKMVLQTLSGELGGNPNKWFLTEDGLYEVLMQSRKPIAKQFKKGVKEILRQIRIYGVFYAQLPKDYLSALKALVNCEEEKEQLVIENARLDTENNILTKENYELEQEKNEANEKVSMALDYIKNVNPKARAWSKLVDTDGLFTISQFASKIGFTPQKLNKYLSGKGIITENHKKPTCKFLNKGYFGVKEMVINTRSGEKKVTQLMVTSLGEEYITEQLFKDNLLDINQTTKQISLEIF